MTIFEQAQHIFSGWKNYLFQKQLSPDQYRVIQRRIESCLNCKYHESTRIKVTVNLATNEKEKIEIGKCGICDCPLIAATASFGYHCPLPNYKGKQFPEPNRWGPVRFDHNSELVDGDGVFITESNKG